MAGQCGDSIREELIATSSLQDHTLEDWELRIFLWITWQCTVCVRETSHVTTKSVVTLFTHPSGIHINLDSSKV